MIIAGAAQQRSAVVSFPYFEMIVKTDNAGTSDNDQFTIPTLGGGYNYTVETSEQLLTNQTGNVTLEWASAGTYWVRITGNFPRIFFNNGGDRLKLLEVSNWGDIAWSSMGVAFNGCSNFNITANDAPILSNVTDMSQMFRNASTLNADLNHWDVGNVTAMNVMFFGASAFNGDISGWNVSGVERMDSMFWDATNFNSDIANWDVGSVTNMDIMFFNAATFNRDLSGWCVEQIASAPTLFDRNANSWVLPRPNWGDPC